MKLKWLWGNEWVRRCFTPLAGLCGAVSTISAADTNAPPAKAAPAPSPMTPEQMFEGGTNPYSNWLELGAGGLLRNGNPAQSQQRRQMPGTAYGGIEDLHFKGNLNTNTTITVDGRGLFDNNDYKLNVAIEREKVGYVRFGYREFRTWSNGDGGYYPPAAANYPLGGNALALDRGELFVEGGLTLEKKPKVTFKYTHTFRNGDEGSTSWGYAHPALGVTEGFSPTVYHIDEHADAFQLDVSHEIKATTLNAGVRFEMGHLNETLKVDQYPGEPVQNNFGDGQGTSYNLFNGHFSSETWLKKNVMLGTGFSYSHLEDTYAGSRAYSSELPGYDPAQNGFGYNALNGGARMNDYVLDLSLFTIPLKNFTIVPSLRVERQDWDADSSGIGTLSDYAPVAFATTGERGMLDVRERLDLRYNGLTNWVFYGRAELTEGEGDLKETGGMPQINGIGVPPLGPQTTETDDSRLFQKYTAGARWYPLRRVAIDASGYYKRDDYNYNNPTDVTANDITSVDRYPAYLVAQNFETYDASLRLTLRPWRNVNLVSRYEHQWSTVLTTPDAISTLPQVESSSLDSHILGQDVGWSPWSRLYLQAGFTYVLSKTTTPGADAPLAVTPTIPGVLPSQNDYWMLNFSSTFVLNDKTDLNLGYFYYRANNHYDNAAAGVLYGSDAQEHSLSASVVYRMRHNIRLILRYGYSHYDDVAFGGQRNYEAHVVSTSLQYRF